MIRINLLPHREAKRKQNKNAFFRMLILTAVFGAAVVFAVAVIIESKISDQAQRNAYIKDQNKKLDDQIAEIASLKDDIEALKARQQAVEDLQSDRNQPVYLLDELVKQVPEGIFLRSFKQDGQKVSMVGIAQSNERVSELLHNFTYNSAWLEHPELIESKSSSMGQGRDSKKVFEFTMAVGIKRPRDKDKDLQGKTGAPNAKDEKDKSVEPPAAASAGNPADKALMPTDKPATGGKPAVPTDNKPPTTGDKAAAAKSASDAVASGAAVNAPKKP